jgi:hypothetical protein
MKDKITNSINDIKTIGKNFAVLVEATSLIVVAVYAIKQALEMQERGFAFYVLVIAGSIIAVRGAVEFLRHLRK